MPITPPVPLLAADSAAVDALAPSPNHGPRPGDRPPDLLLLHYTGMRSGNEALERLTDPEAEVSAHYLVLEGGRVLQLVPERRRAWHAGAGAWAGDVDINSCSVGIEIAHPGHAGGLPPYPPVQIEAVTRLCADIVRRNAIRPERVLGHSDVAPDRKEDPGELFPWAGLHARGIGHWVEPSRLTPGPAFASGDRGAEVAEFQRLLGRYGYAVDPTGTFDRATEAVVVAFQRHFRPARLDGVADVSTRTTLDALIAALPG